MAYGDWLERLAGRERVRDAVPHHRCEAPGVIDAKELAFFAGAGDPGWVDQQFYPGKSSEVALLHGEFEKSALPIGSSFDLGIVHRVSVRQLSVEPTSENVLDDQIRKLEIEITALDVSQADHEVGPKGSCCSVQ